MERIPASVLVLGLAMLPALAGPHAGEDKAKTVPPGSHSGWVISVAFSPDGTRVLSGASTPQPNCGRHPPGSSSEPSNTKAQSTGAKGLTN